MAGGERAFRLLGPLEVSDSGQILALGPPKQRALLAVLLLHANEPVSAEGLLDALWEERPPETAATSIQGYVSKLRKLLGAETIVTEARGYRLDAPPETIDASRFEGLVADGAEQLAAGRHVDAAETLQAALDLWRGPALADFRYETFAQTESARLEELRLTAIESHLEASLELGHAAELIGRLTSLVAEHPLRERLRRHLMVALYRAGRQADALTAYRDARVALAELGLDPSRELQELERAILNQDSSLSAAQPRARTRALPVFTTPLVGRRAEVAAVAELLRNPEVRLVTLSGPGGTGKTRLSLELLATLEDEFRDGAVFVPLAPVTDPELVIPAVAQAVGVKEVSGEPLEATLSLQLRGRRMLVVLDNLEQLTAAADRVHALLAGAPEVQILVTSRAPLRLSAEHEFPVPPLEREDALELLVERARAVRPEFAPSGDEETLLADICDRLDGLPLAIELAGARLKLLSPKAMLSRLDERLRLLTGGARDLPERQRTLRATLDWSHALLEPDEQRVFARLAVFAGGATLEDAEAVCGDDVDLFEAVASLVDKSLIRTTEQADGETRVRMLQTIREYARERLEESDEHEEIVQRHAEHYAALAARAQPELIRPDQAVWLDRLELEHDNLRAALVVLLERPEPDPAVELASSLWRYWETRGHLTEGAGWLDRALAHGEGAAPRNVALALNAAGCLADGRGENEVAIEHHQRAQALFAELGDLRGEAWSLNNLGLVLAKQRRLRESAELHERALAIARELDEKWLLASSLINLSNVAFFERRYDQAEELQEEGLRLCLELGDEWRAALARLNLGWIHVCQGELERATGRLGESIEAFRRLGERRWLPDALEGLAAVAAETGRAARAAALFGAADALRSAIDAPVGETEQAIYEPFLARVRGDLGAGFEDALAAGRGLDAEQAVALALEPAAVAS